MSSYPKNGPNKYSKFSKNSIDHFKSAIGNIIWDEVLVSQDINSAYSLFLKSFNKALDLSFPLTSTKSRNKYSKGKPWIFDELKKLSRKKNKLYRSSNFNPSSINTETYKKCKNHFTSLVRKAKKAYYSNQCVQASKNIKTTSHLINHLLNRTKSPFTAPVVMNSKKGVLSNPVDIANGFNDFFYIGWF